MSGGQRRLQRVVDLEVEQRRPFARVVELDPNAVAGTASARSELKPRPSCTAVSALWNSTGRPCAQPKKSSTGTEMLGSSASS